jgi:sterol desaturase/sphingolipid hydroxylase (fatty acid hydroxylase superfamily)
MEPIIVYFESIPSRDRSLILAGGIAFFWLIETAFPLFRFSYKKWKHATVNIFFTLTTIVVNFALAFILLQTSTWTQANQWGLLSFIDHIPLIWFTLFGLLGLDLISAYFIHWLEHKIRFMWRFHLIHHTDIHVDTTTANRHHPGESVFRFVFTTLAVFILGAPVWLIMLYQALSVVLSQFNHANIRLPEKLDRWLSLAIVTPNMHHVHHHYVLPETDSNYGNIFSIWDRIFGTFRYMKQADIQYGIDTYPEEEAHSKISKMLQIPFAPYRSARGSKFSSEK